MISQAERTLIYLSMNEIQNKKQELLLECFADLEEFTVDNVVRNRNGILSGEEVMKLARGYDAGKLNSEISNMLSNKIKILTVLSENYPKSLLSLPSDRPLVLYAKGDLSLLNEQCFAIVGTRYPSNYGKMVTEKFAKKLAESGLVIVSGLCFGVDEIAHRGALAVDGKTIAIIASGFGHIYPATNTALSHEIAEKGLLLSEYPPSFIAKKYTFPRRNRIVAGVSEGILITEAGLKSGTVHTKEFALEYGKDVFVVPGNITSSKSELTNQMLAQRQADCALSPEYILEYYGLEGKAKEKKAVSVSIDEQLILNLLADEEHDFDFLAQNSKIPVNILNSCLTTLEIRGLIRKLPAQMYARIC